MKALRFHGALSQELGYLGIGLGEIIRNLHPAGRRNLLHPCAL